MQCNHYFIDAAPSLRFIPVGVEKLGFEEGVLLFPRVSSDAFFFFPGWLLRACDLWSRFRAKEPHQSLQVLCHGSQVELFTYELESA